MSKSMIKWLLMLTALYQTMVVAKDGLKDPSYNVSYNILQTAVVVGANNLFIKKSAPELSYWPFHFDMQKKVNDKLSLDFGLVYRYENYHDSGPITTKNNVIRAKKVWTNFHEFFLLAGPRWSPYATGLEGFYLAAKGGLGTAISPQYFSLSFLMQPEGGYVISFANPGLSLTLGLGLLLNMPFYETRPFAVRWKRKASFTPLGVVMHEAIPILNLSLGFNW